MKKTSSNRPEKKEESVEEQIASTINQLKNCPRVIKENELQGFLKQKERCENFIEKGIIDRMLQIKAQVRMMNLDEYCPTYLAYLNGVIAFLEKDLETNQNLE